MRNFKLFFLITSVMIFFQNCASFEKSLSNPNELRVENLSELNGNYEIQPFESYSVQENSKTQIPMYTNFYSEIISKSEIESFKLDSLKTYHFELSVINDKNLKVTFFENDRIFKTVTIKAKLMEDGYFYLKDKRLKFRGIPYLLGGINFIKTRMTLDANQNLIFDKLEHNSGAAFIVIFADGRTYKYRYTYKRIN